MKRSFVVGACLLWASLSEAQPVFTTADATLSNDALWAACVAGKGKDGPGQVAYRIARKEGQSQEQAETVRLVVEFNFTLFLLHHQGSKAEFCHQLVGQ